MNGTILERLRGTRRIHVDAPALIYFIEEHPRYLHVVDPIFRLIADAQLAGLSSFITLIEVLVKPLRDRRPDLARKYTELLCDSQGFSLFILDRQVAETGSLIRARFGFRTPDAIQLATALIHGAQAFLTNDHRLKSFDQLDVIMLDDFADPKPGSSAGVDNK